MPIGNKYKTIRREEYNSLISQIKELTEKNRQYTKAYQNSEEFENSYNALLQDYNDINNQFSIRCFCIIDEYFNNAINFELYQSNCTEDNDTLYYEIIYYGVENSYLKRNVRIENEVNQHCLLIKNTWLEYGYDKNVNIMVVSEFNTERVYFSSYNGEIDFTIHDVVEEVEDSDLEYFIE